MTETDPRLAEAAAFAAAQDSPFPRDLLAHLEGGHFEPPPYNAVLGPVFPRGAPNGLVLQRGQRLASWGDTRQADMTFSAAKSYLCCPTSMSRCECGCRMAASNQPRTRRSPGATC